jgi:hypothetical protein
LENVGWQKPTDRDRNDSKAPHMILILSLSLIKTKSHHPLHQKLSSQQGERERERERRKKKIDILSCLIKIGLLNCEKNHHS